MSKTEGTGIAIPSISKEARVFNSLTLDSTVQGIKTASSLDRQIIEAERTQKESRANQVKEEMPIPTGEEIRKAREEGEYR